MERRTSILSSPLHLMEKRTSILSSPLENIGLKFTSPQFTYKNSGFWDHIIRGEPSEVYSRGTQLLRVDMSSYEYLGGVQYGKPCLC